MGGRGSDRGKTGIIGQFAAQVADKFVGGFAGRPARACNACLHNAAERRAVGGDNCILAEPTLHRMLP